MIDCITFPSSRSNARLIWSPASLRDVIVAEIQPSSLLSATNQTRTPYRISASHWNERTSV